MGRHTESAEAQRYGQHAPENTGTAPDPDARGVRPTGAHRAYDGPGAVAGGRTRDLTLVQPGG